MERLERVITIVIAKPLALALYGLWLALCWCGRGVAGIWAWTQRWAHARGQKRHLRHRVAL